jgi:hypothetical protein
MNNGHMLLFTYIALWAVLGFLGMWLLTVLERPMKVNKISEEVENVSAREKTPNLDSEITREQAEPVYQRK